MPLFGMRTFRVLLLSFVVLDPARLHAQHVTASPYRTAEFASYVALLGRYEAGDYTGAADAAARLNVHSARRLARLVLDDIDQEMILLRRLKAATPEAPTSSVLNDLRRERVRRLRLAIARKATTDLLHRLTPADRFAIVAFGDQVGRVSYPGASVAEQTGGRYVKAEWDSSLGERFQQILREYRQRYILTFTPEGVKTGDGWHALEVKVKRGDALVRARTRYWAGKA